MSEGTSSGAWEIGEKYFVRCVTYHYLGKLERIDGRELVLSSASWVADSGRWGDALASGKLSEVEPYPGSVIINRSAIVDASVWSHDLP